MTNDDEQLGAHLSHEFRNALACIFQFGNILIGGLAGELSEEQREYVGIMLKNASRIRTLLDSMTQAVAAGR
jgi:signal transduction histidine kinase